MATSMIDRYRKILDADPSSMVFVEMAKALLDKGQLEEAIDCCKKGLVHHPDSIVGHVLWGRSLIDLGLPDEAMDQFDKAMAIDADNPYAYNLIGEALLHRRLYRSALPVLQRAVSLQPGDRRVRQWLTQAEKAVGEVSGESSALPVAEPTVADRASVFDSAFDQVGAGSSSVGVGSQVDTTEVAVGALDTATGSSPSTPWQGGRDIDETQVVSALQVEMETDEGDWPGMPSPEPADQLSADLPWPGMPPSEAAEEQSDDRDWPGMPRMKEPGSPVDAWQTERSSEDVWPSAGGPDRQDHGMGGTLPDTNGEEEDLVLSGMTATFQALEDAGELDNAPWDQRSAHAPEDEDYEEEAAPRPPPPPGMPPPLPPARKAAAPPPPPQVVEVFGLELPPLPGQEQGPAARAAAIEKKEEDTGVTQALAAEYERELREKLISSGERPGKKRKTIFMVFGGLTLLVALTAGIAFVWGTISGREEAIATGLDAARNGIARDTYAGYVAALDRLSEVLRMDAEEPTARAMAAAAEAILFADLDPNPERRARAESYLADPELAELHPDEVLDARYHLADKEGREAVAGEVSLALEAREDSATLHFLAGSHHLASGRTEEATAHFTKAMEIQPGHARTVVALANHFAASERWEEALTYYDNARTNYPGHGRAELGAAEARLALKREMAEALAFVLELNRDHGDNLAAAERRNLEIVAARLQHATGDTESALVRLRRARDAHPSSASIPLLMAEMYLSSYDLVSALESVERAAGLNPAGTEIKLLKARILTSWSRYGEAAASLEAVEEPDRRIWLERAIIAYHAGDRRAARRALDNTRNEEGQMSADAAIYLALVDMADDARSAQTVLNRAARARGADALVEWALGRWNLEQNNERPARHHMGKAVEEDPKYYRAHSDLAALELRTQTYDRALVHLTAALEVNSYFKEALQMLGESHLALGEAEPARDAFRRILAHHTEDAGAHRGLALALLDLGELEGAETHARASVEHGRQESQAHHALGRVLLAKGQAAESIPVLVQARRRDPESADILSDLAQAHLDRGQAPDRRQARRYLEQALEKDARNAVAHWRLGAILLVERDIRASLQSLNQAVNLFRRAGDDRRLAAATIDLSRAHADGGGRGGLERARRAAIESVRIRDTAEGREQLALVYIEETRPVLARQQLEQAVGLDPNRATVHFLLGKILAEAGEKDPAREALERALVLAPRGGHVREARQLLAGLGD